MKRIKNRVIVVIVVMKARIRSNNREKIRMMKCLVQILMRKFPIKRTKSQPLKMSPSKATLNNKGQVNTKRRDQAIKKENKKP